MDFGILDFLYVVGSLAFFIYGMKVMSDGIQKAAGSQIRRIIRSMTRNRFLGVLTGTAATALVQSSSATTVMTVSFVNAGLLTLVQSAGVMMGANIGTTITAWLVSIGGFRLELHQLSLPLFAVAVPLFFRGKRKSIYWAEFILGIALLFLGLEFLKTSIPEINEDSGILRSLADFTRWGFLSRLLFVVVGAVLTIIIQSSSAAITLTLTMCINGWLPFELAAAMVLGENIGTTITAEIAAFVGNIHAKRSARIHSLFNVIGVTWMVVVLPLFLSALAWILHDGFGLSDPFSNAQSMTIAVAAFHTVFNVLNMLLLIGFVPWLVQLARWTLPVRSKSDKKRRLRYIGSRSRSPELATIEIQTELANFGQMTAQMADCARGMLNSTDQNEQHKLIRKIRKLDKRCHKMGLDITQYVAFLSREEVTEKTSKRLQVYLSICHDLQRIGDIFNNMALDTKDKIAEKTWFTPPQRNNLNEIFDLLDQAFVVMCRNLKSGSYDSVNLESAQVVENRINALRDEYKRTNLDHATEFDFQLKGFMLYNRLLSSLEQIGDHVLLVTTAITKNK